MFHMNTEDKPTLTGTVLRWVILPIKLVPKVTTKHVTKLLTKPLHRSQYILGINFSVVGL